MKFFLLFLMIACTVMDISKSPSELHQMRLVMKLDSVTEVGLHGGITTGQLSIRTYGKGTAIIRGYEGCGQQDSVSFNEYGWATFDLSKLDIPDYCIFTVKLTTNKFDAPAIGKILIKKFTNPNILPLGIIANGVYRDGVNFVQVAASPTRNKSIGESNEIILSLNKHVGELKITGCGMTMQKIPYDETMEYYRTTLPELYKTISAEGMIDRDCTFVFMANHNDTIKQMGMVMVNVYQDFGVWLAAPIYNDGCFKFTDEYIAGVIVNGKQQDCDKHANSWIVEGVTTKHRIFYGEFENGEWKVQK
jgi:hypothetical protein